MADNVYWPLEIHTVTGEPILRLVPPHENIIITPQRADDVDALPPIMNDPTVCVWLLNPPYPYKREDAAWFVARNLAHQDELRTELEKAVAAAGAAERVLVSSTPVRAIREVRADGTEVFIGDLFLAPQRWGHVEEGQRDKLVEENMARELGDPEKCYEMCDFLAPSHHGKGIMTAAVRAMIDKWAVPRMGVHKIDCTTFLTNIGSRRVFEKNGFVWTTSVQDCFAVQESKGGGKVGVHVLAWTRP